MTANNESSQGLPVERSDPSLTADNRVKRVPLSDVNQDSIRKNSSLTIAPVVSGENHDKWLRLEVAILIIALVIVWTALFLPIIFFYIPVDMVREAV